ncbi:MAG: type I DNA topoisomerase [Phycisphaerales bacterium]|nr:type I DNA topoisomerase [Phycisphaerales bacterium]
MAKRAAKTTSCTPRSAPANPSPTSGAERGSARPAGRRGKGFGPRKSNFTAGSAKGKHLVIVESPAKAKTINKYLGPEYLVLASLGHVRDLPSKNPKGDKSPVPGVDLRHRFRPTYQTLEGKENVLRDLKRAAKESRDSGMEVWFATDLDREGEAIAWHLAQEVGIDSPSAKRVVFAAITKDEIRRAFDKPHPIDEDKVNAQQARRILDRIVGYQVSPLLWKKVARGLSAGRVQSVAVRLVVEREREIRSFVPDEHWSIRGCFALDPDKAERLESEWRAFLASRDDKGQGPTQKARLAWLAEHQAISAELVAIDGAKVELSGPSGAKDPKAAGDALMARASVIAGRCGLRDIRTRVTEDPKGRGPARFKRTIEGEIDASRPWTISAIETKRTRVRPAAPFITSTLQQAASSRLGFGAQRTMRAAQQLYEGVDIPGEGPVGLITYMRTDSTHLSSEAIDMARDFIRRSFGDRYVPEKANVYESSNKAAQEAHEAIRPTSLNHPPERLRHVLKPDQFRLYQIIWERFVACQMVPAEWDSTGVSIESNGLTFRATGRTLVFDGFYRVAGVPPASDTATLPTLREAQKLFAFGAEADQGFSSPPARYSEASLIKKLEEEGIGRPSTYAAIIQTIQDRKYVEQADRRFFATDLGEVVTDKLVEAFPQIMDVGYTRQMEGELDKVEEDHLDWIDMLSRFYGPFTEALERAQDELTHAKAEITPAPKEYRCAKCGSDLVYRFGRNGRFLSCSRFPECDYAAPIDREGKPRTAETVDVACPICASPMSRRTGRFGPFLSCSRYGDKTSPCTGILNLDKKGHVVAPSTPPLVTELPCPTCGEALNLRSGVRGPWLGCSRFPKCRGRGKWNELDDTTRAALQAALEAHERANPVKIIRTLSGKHLTDAKGKPLPDAPLVTQLATDEGEGEDRAAG